MNKAQKRLALDALVSPRPPSLGGGFGGEPLLSAADEVAVFLPPHCVFFFFCFEHQQFPLFT